MLRLYHAPGVSAADTGAVCENRDMLPVVASGAPGELALVRGLPRNTEENYNSHIREFNRWNGGRPISEDRLREYFAGQASRLSPATLRVRKSALRMALEHTLPGMHDTRLLAALDASFERIRITRPRETLAERDILSIDEVSCLMRALPEMYARLIEALYSSGFRISELLGVRLRDCRVTQGWVSVRVIGKRRREREILAWRADLQRAILQASGARGDQAFLFQNRITGRALSRQYVWRLVRRTARSTLGRAAHPHMFRHSHATALLTAGVPIDAVARRLGHADAGTTARYYAHTQIRREQLEAAVPVFADTAR